AGGGGDDGDHGEDGGAPDGASALPLSNGRLAMMLALIASTMLFSGLIGAFIVLRGSSPVWPPPGSPPMPSGLWINTVLVVASSVLLVIAHVAQRRGAARTMALTLIAAALAASAFLVLQIH